MARKTFGKPDWNAIQIDTNSHQSGVDINYDAGGFYDFEEFEYENDDPRLLPLERREAKKKAIRSAIKDLTEMQTAVTQAKTWLREQFQAIK